MDNDSMLVSCIIPTHNRAQLLSRAVESVLNQTYRNIELLIIDNASSDETKSLALSYVSKDNRVRYLYYSKSANAAATRNFGFAHITGKYVAFLDDDDEWLPIKIEQQLKYADLYSVIGCRYYNFHSSFRRLSLVKQKTQDFLNKNLPDIRELTVSDLLRDNSGLSPTTILMRSEYFGQLHGFDEDLVGPEGRDLFLRLTSNFGKAAVLNERLAIRHAEHNLGSITTKPALIEGAWKEFYKNQHLMNAEQQRYRLIQIYFFEVLFSSNSPSHKRGSLFSAFTQLRIRELKNQVYLFAIFFLFHGSKLFKRGFLR